MAKKASANKTNKTAAKAAKTTKKKDVSTSKAKKTVVKKTLKVKPAAKKTAGKTTAKTSGKAAITKKAAPKAKSAAAKTKQVKKSPAARVIEVIAKPKKTKIVKSYSKKDLESFKEVIMEKRAEIMEQLQDLRDQMMDPSTGQYVNESSPYSLHMAEQGTDAQEREKLYLWAQRENKFLGYLEEALQRIENGSYGICIECIDDPKFLCPTCPLVPKERLMAVPHTQMCVQVKMNQKK
jgi:DnaK suppressor protein